MIAWHLTSEKGVLKFSEIFRTIHEAGGEALFHFPPIPNVGEQKTFFFSIQGLKWHFEAKEKLMFLCDACNSALATAASVVIETEVKVLQSTLFNHFGDDALLSMAVE